MFATIKGLKVWNAPWESVYGSAQREAVAASAARIKARDNTGSTYGAGTFGFPALRAQDPFGEDYTLLSRDRDTGASVAVGNIFLQTDDVVVIDLSYGKLTAILGRSASYQPRAAAAA